MSRCFGFRSLSPRTNIIEFQSPLSFDVVLRVLWLCNFIIRRGTAEPRVCVISIVLTIILLASSTDIRQRLVHIIVGVMTEGTDGFGAIGTRRESFWSSFWLLFSVYVYTHAYIRPIEDIILDSCTGLHWCSPYGSWTRITPIQSRKINANPMYADFRKGRDQRDGPGGEQRGVDGPFRGNEFSRFSRTPPRLR